MLTTWWLCVDRTAVDDVDGGQQQWRLAAQLQRWTIENKNRVTKIANEIQRSSRDKIGCNATGTGPTMAKSQCVSRETCEMSWVSERVMVNKIKQHSNKQQCGSALLQEFLLTRCGEFTMPVEHFVEVNCAVFIHNFFMHRFFWFFCE